MSDLRGKRILISGAAGFLGANLVYALERREAEIHALVRSSTQRWRLAEIESKIAIHFADLTDLAELNAVMRNVRPEIVFHSAVFNGHPMNPGERLASLKDDIVATATLIEALRPHDFERLVHLGSSLEYGSKDAPMAESDLLEPFTNRGVTKAASTFLCMQLALAEKRPVVTVRPFSVFGYWETSTRLIPTLMLTLLNRGRMKLTATGFRRDFIFVEDVVDACLLAATKAEAVGEIINAGSGVEWSNEEVVELAQEVSGIHLDVIPEAFRNRPADAHHWVADIRKAERLLGWRPRYDLRQGLEKTFAWFSEHRYLYGNR